MNPSIKHTLTHSLSRLHAKESFEHAPRILMLYGSLRSGSFSKKLVDEAKEILESLGADVRIYNPDGLPVFDNVQTNHPKVQELRELAQWSEGMVWCSPELHGNFTSVFKNQIDWIPLSDGAVRPTQGKVLALMQITGGSQSFNVVNNMRILGRWMRMFTIPNQSSVPKAYSEFDANGTMKNSPLKDRVIDVMDELFKMTLILRENKEWLTERHSEKKSFDSEKLKKAIACC